MSNGNDNIKGKHNEMKYENEMNKMIDGHEMIFFTKISETRQET